MISKLYGAERWASEQITSKLDGPSRVHHDSAQRQHRWRLARSVKVIRLGIGGHKSPRESPSTFTTTKIHSAVHYRRRLHFSDAVYTFQTRLHFQSVNTFGRIQRSGRAASLPIFSGIAPQSPIPRSFAAVRASFRRPGSECESKASSNRPNLCELTLQVIPTQECKTNAML
jgi:hypothetical protein